MELSNASKMQDYLEWVYKMSFSYICVFAHDMIIVIFLYLS